MNNSAESPNLGGSKGSDRQKGGKGKKWKGKGGVLEGKAVRSPLMRGHPYHSAIRLRLISEEPADLPEPRRFTVAMAFRPGTTEELMGTLALEALSLENAADVEVVSPAEGLVHLTMSAATFSLIPAIVKARGHFSLASDDPPRGIFIFEDESECAEIKKEQHWNIRFTGCLEGSYAIDRDQMIKILEHSMATELRKETRRVDLAGQKWCAATAPDSVTAYRLWTLFRRTQGLTGPATVSHSLVDPWALVHHGSIQTSHNDRGIPSDHTKANVVHDGVRMRPPPFWGKL